MRGFDVKFSREHLITALIIVTSQALTLKAVLADCCSCKLHRETERRAARGLESEQGLSPAASLCSSAPSHLPPSLGHRNRVPQHESGD